MLEVFKSIKNYSVPIVTHLRSNLIGTNKAIFFFKAIELLAQGGGERKLKKDQKTKLWNTFPKTNSPSGCRCNYMAFCVCGVQTLLLGNLTVKGTISQGRFSGCSVPVTHVYNPAEDHFSCAIQSNLQRGQRANPFH